MNYAEPREAIHSKLDEISAELATLRLLLNLATVTLIPIAMPVTALRPGGRLLIELHSQMPVRLLEAECLVGSTKHSLEVIKNGEIVPDHTIGQYTIAATENAPDTTVFLRLTVTRIEFESGLAADLERITALTTTLSAYTNQLAGEEDQDDAMQISILNSALAPNAV